MILFDKSQRQKYISPVNALLNSPSPFRTVLIFSKTFDPCMHGLSNDSHKYTITKREKGFDFELTS